MPRCIKAAQRVAEAATKAAAKTSVIVMQVDAYEGWTAQGHAWWETGSAEVSESENVRARHVDVEAGRADQRQGV